MKIHNLSESIDEIKNLTEKIYEIITADESTTPVTKKVIILVIIIVVLMSATKLKSTASNRFNDGKRALTYIVHDTVTNKITPITGINSTRHHITEVGITNHDYFNFLWHFILHGKVPEAPAKVLEEKDQIQVFSTGDALQT